VASYSPDGTRQAVQRVLLDAERTRFTRPDDGVVIPDAFDESWAKVVLSASEWASMTDLLPAIADARTRVTVWNALQLATADAEIEPQLALAIVRAALPAETDDAVLGAVGRWAEHTVVRRYLDDAHRPNASARLAEMLLELAEGGVPGSGRQLAAARTAIAATGDAARLRDWLADRRPPAGLVVDAELRWAILHRLAALGELDEAGIAAELERDRSSSGVVHAARCRAARPDAAAKQAAWTALMSDPQRPNYELYALAEGFWDPDQLAITGPYVEAYFAELPAAARLRSGWVADRVALLAYPWPAVSPSTAAATDALLAADRLPAGVRRSVVDAGDDLTRALRIRQRFGLAGSGT
jgi:aminopeptidase N